MSEKTWQMTNKYFNLNFIFVFHNGLGKSFFFADKRSKEETNVDSIHELLIWK